MARDFVNSKSPRKKRKVAVHRRRKVAAIVPPAPALSPAAFKSPPPPAVPVPCPRHLRWLLIETSGELDIWSKGRAQYARNVAAKKNFGDVAESATAAEKIRLVRERVRLSINNLPATPELIDVLLTAAVELEIEWKREDASIYTRTRWGWTHSWEHSGIAHRLGDLRDRLREAAEDLMLD